MTSAFESLDSKYGTLIKGREWPLTPVVRVVSSYVVAEGSNNHLSPADGCSTSPHGFFLVKYMSKHGKGGVK